MLELEYKQDGLHFERLLSVKMLFDAKYKHLWLQARRK